MHIKVSSCMESSCVLSVTTPRLGADLCDLWACMAMNTRRMVPYARTDAQKPVLWCSWLLLPSKTSKVWFENVNVPSRTSKVPF